MGRSLSRVMQIATATPWPEAEHESGTGRGRAVEGQSAIRGRQAPVSWAGQGTLSWRTAARHM